VKTRFMKPDRHTLLSLKMNPSLDTSVTGALLTDKAALIELMENEYDRCLIAREKQLRAGAHQEDCVTEGEEKETSTLPAEPSSDTVEPCAAAETDQFALEPVSKRRRKTLNELTQQVQVAPPPRPPTAAVVPCALQQEKTLYQSLAQDPELLSKFKNPKTCEFDLIRFWDVNKSVLPIHNLVFRGDVGPKKAASANVEFVFSAAGSLLADYHANNLSPTVLQQYMVVGGNWKFPWLRPTLDCITKAYKQAFKFSDAEDRKLPESEGECDTTADTAEVSTEPPVIAVE